MKILLFLIILSIFSFSLLSIPLKKKIGSIKENKSLTENFSNILDMELNEFLK
mgnify:CR=1